MEKLCLCIGISCVPREMKGSETLLMSILSEKRLTLHENITLALSLLTGKIEKAYLARNFFYLPERRNSRHFKLGTWRAAKTRACLLRLTKEFVAGTARPMTTSNTLLINHEYIYIYSTMILTLRRNVESEKNPSPRWDLNPQPSVI